MSRLRPFLLALLVAGSVGVAGEVVAKQYLGGFGSARRGLPPPARPKLTQSAPAVSPVQLPNGASSISETYGKWVVDCRLIDKQKQCRLLQTQSTSQTNQRTLEVELRVPKDGKVDGTIVMPFGLKLDSGVILRLDDKDRSEVLHFLTCIPSGCLVPVSFLMTGIDAMKNSKILTVASLNLSDEIITFNVPLDGFAAAIARLVELGGWTPANSSQGAADD